MATELAPLATAAGPATTEFAPLAVESALVELAWKYFTPLSWILTTWVLRSSTAWLVAYSCEPFTASVLVALRRPAATLVRVRSLPTEPTLTVLVGLVPAKS
ncbi:hypothetical protein D9M71_581160 [compost metagenome]